MPIISVDNLKNLYYIGMFLNNEAGFHNIQLQADLDNLSTSFNIHSDMSINELHEYSNEYNRLRNKVWEMFRDYIIQFDDEDYDGNKLNIDPNKFTNNIFEEINKLNFDNYASARDELLNIFTEIYGYMVHFQ